MPSARFAPPAAQGLIALDWGTTSLRAFRMAASGELLETRQRPWGIMKLPGATTPPAGRTPDTAFENALQQTCGDWMAAAPGWPLLACGMVGSAQGWREAGYVNSPAALDDLAHHLTLVPRGDAPPLYIVPGLLQPGTLPDVMRGEETQVMGVMAGAEFPPDAPVLIGLPGTHSKWVVAQRGRIERFHTFMTGEVFAALREHTILGRTMQPATKANDDAFARGVAATMGSEADLGLLAHIFTTRTLHLTGALEPSAQADYLSGVLIGHEVASLASLQTRLTGASAAPTPVLCGEPDLCRRYAAALRTFGFPSPAVVEHAAARGLWRIALGAGLVHAPAPRLQPLPRASVSI